MSDFRFENLYWSHALWLVAALVALLLWLDWRRLDVLARFLSTTMQSRLVHRLSRTRRWLSIGLFGLAAAMLVVALMRPQWGLTYYKTPRVGAQIMVCLDVSKSMLAEDTAPNRLERAKAELTDLLSFLDGDQVGLVAFAGRGSVLCPLTPDFGFFRLILDSAGPHSVGRGGTRLEEPIRKALAGFRTEADVSRVIVLITDGEDHDSHPLDAAKAAAERGVTILAIGFGDEAGSEIHITNPETGVRSTVRDADGGTVISRLDGELLRDMALATEGAYIPAGTGALDLKSIYEAHIAPLVRGQLDDRGHAVRREAYQWPLLVGLLLLVVSVVVGSGSVKSEMQMPAPISHSSGRARTGTAVLLIAVASAAAAHAQQSPPPRDNPPATTANGVTELPSSEGDTADGDTGRGAQPAPEDSENSSEDPRDLYNEALTHLGSDFDRAERLLNEARREADTDGEVRFRATYNMGWLEVNRADAVLDDKPEEALAILRRAADWFRDAVRLRPEHSDARHNLEVVLRRILQLADSLAKSDDRDLTQRLDALIDAQRGLVGTSRQVVQRVTSRDDPNAADQFRSDFRQLALEQRKILSDGQALANTGREELDALDGKKDEERTPEENLRRAQLSNLLNYANRAHQRMGQARSQMRRRQAERAFRRSAAALAELKRARDQLRGPVEVLDVIIADALSLAQLTTLKAELSDVRASGLGQGPDEPQRPAAPAWLTREYLEEGQLSITERTSELTARLQAGLEGHESETADTSAPEEQQENAGAERFLEMVRAAMPFLKKGEAAFESAGRTLATDEFEVAGQEQFEAMGALRNARERFLELRGLIELAHARETAVQQLLSPPKEDAVPAEGDSSAGDADQESAPDEAGGVEQPDSAAEASESTEPPDEPESPRAVREWPRDQLRMILPLAQQFQDENLERGERIGKLIEEGLAGLPAPVENDEESSPGTPAANASDPAAQQAAARRQQLQLAQHFLGLAMNEMRAAAESLTKAADSFQPPDDETDVPDETVASPAAAEDTVAASREHVAQAVEHLQSLRRLFYSIIEHLRETAQRQAQLNDETEQVAALEDNEDLAVKAGPLAVRQELLRTVTEQIAQALDEQARQAPPTDSGPQGVDPKQLEQLQQISEQLAKAAELVTEGGTAMQQAGKSLSAERLELDPARASQDEALQKLVEALALLSPPQPDQQNQENQQQQQGDQQQSEQEQQQQEQDRQAGVDPSRLLQAVRDREAQRRRDQERRQRLQQEPVEKDW